MAFVVATKRGGFEVRESTNTSKGPRSHTLASFRELTDEVIDKARAKAANPPSAEELRRAARRAGAPVAGRPIDRAARELIAELGKGRRLDPTLRHILVDLLRESQKDRPEISAGDLGPSVAAWIAATPEERGNALVDLLLLADALPPRRKKEPLRFPRLDSTHP